mgnify:CR=1 FL=1
MKTTTIFWLLIMSMALVLPAHSQEVSVNLNKAKEAYGSGNLHDSRFALQQALADVDQELGKEILAMLPANLGSLPYLEEEDNVTGNAAGITGMYVNRSYRDPERSINLELIDDSPMLAAVNRLLSLPVFIGAGDPNQKRVKIHGYKALLQKETDDSTGVVNFNIQVPFNQSMFTFRSVGFDSENEIIGLAESLPLEAIVRMTK